MESDIRKVAMSTPYEFVLFMLKYESLLDETDFLNLCNDLLDIAIEYRYDLNHALPKTIYTSMHVKIEESRSEVITHDFIDEQTFNKLLVPVIKHFITHSLMYQYTLESFYVSYVSTSQILLTYKDKHESRN